MIKFENFETVGWEHAIRGMRNPKNSWAKSDSYFTDDCGRISCENCIHWHDGCTDTSPLKFVIAPNDHELMMKLRNAGTDHRKFMRQIIVYVDITAPLYWWKEFDTYKVGTVANSCSTMHTIHQKEFTLEDFSHEKLAGPALSALRNTIVILNVYRDLFVNWDKKTDNTKDALLVDLLEEGETYDRKMAWEQMIQLLTTSYNQRRTVMFSYENLANMFHSREFHKLDEWRTMCAWMKTLPYSELITGKMEEEV